MEITIKHSFNLLTSTAPGWIQNGRNIHSILGDGNYLFRALSHQLYVTDEHHLFLRTTLFWYESFLLKRTWYHQWMSTAYHPIATATLTGKPVYILMNSSWQIQWEVDSISASYKNRKSEAIYYWGWQCSCLPCSISHLELLYNNTTKHNDSILSQDTGLPHTVEPFIKRSDSFVDLI